MKVQNVQYKNNTTNSNLRNKNINSPIHESLKTAGVWLGFGLGFDVFTRKCVVFKNSPIKNSLFINTTLALIASTYTYIKSIVQKKQKL